MDRYLPSIIIGAVFVLAIVGMYLGWRARSRAQGDLGDLPPVPAAPGDVLATAHGLYVATTDFQQPLERVTARGLGFRSRAEIRVAPAGITVGLTGREPFFIPRHELRAVQRATWTIDKAVEKRGLVVISWLWGERDVDTYFRLDDDPGEFVAAAAALVEVGQ
ncbi:MAG TPA: ABC transporter permease [Terrimesophilobacter sp.]|nr:ABC transporter permease [Terrimesophilobacter sp.]